jgi:hypothetical protein
VAEKGGEHGVSFRVVVPRGHDDEWEVADIVQAGGVCSWLSDPASGHPLSVCPLRHLLVRRLISETPADFVVSQESAVGFRTEAIKQW